MTLQRFRTLTAGVEPLALRHAMTVALRVEAPRTPEQYARFYRRVVGALPEAPAEAPAGASDPRPRGCCAPRANRARGEIVRYRDVATI